MTMGRKRVRDLRLGVDDDGESEVSFLETIGSTMFIQYLRILLPTTLSLTSLDCFKFSFLNFFFLRHHFHNCFVSVEIFSDSKSEYSSPLIISGIKLDLFHLTLIKHI